MEPSAGGALARRGGGGRGQRPPVSAGMAAPSPRARGPALEPVPCPLSLVFRAGFSRSELRLPQPPPLGSVAKTAHLLVPERESVKWDSSTRLFTFWIIFASILNTRPVNYSMVEKSNLL